jgi:phytoene synthase
MKFWKETYCQADFCHARSLTAFYSKSFYLSACMLPRAERWATFALYAFCRYCDNLVDTPRDRTPGELIEELDVLARELEIAYRTGLSEHPIIRPFIIVARQYNIPIHYPLDLIRGVEMDLLYSRYKTFDELYVFCYRVAAVVGLMMTHVLGYKHDSAFEYATSMGIAMQLTNILRDIREDKENGRIYLPLEELAQFELSETDIIEEKMSPAMSRFMQFQIMRARQYYTDAQAGIALLPTETQFAIHSADKIYRGILHEIEARNYNPFLGRVFVPQRTNQNPFFSGAFSASGNCPPGRPLRSLFHAPERISGNSPC